MGSRGRSAKGFERPVVMDGRHKPGNDKPGNDKPSYDKLRTIVFPS